MRVEQAARRLARLITIAAGVGASAGLLLWWSTVGRRIGQRGPEVAAVVVVAALCLAPAAWLMNVRFALLGLLEIPDKLSGVAARRGARFLDSPLVGPPRTAAGVTGPVLNERTGRLATLRSLRSAFRDYGDVAGSWARLGQLLTPTFWLLTAFALLAVPVLVAASAIAAAVAVIA